MPKKKATTKGRKKSTRRRTQLAKYRLFAKEYIGPCRFNGTEAALRVSPKLSRASAATQATKWLKNAEIQVLLDKEYRRVEARIELTTEQITAQFQSLALFDIREFAEWDEDGTLTFKASEELEPDVARCIAGVTVHSSQHGTDTRFKIHDRIRGLEGLAKIKGMFGHEAPPGTAVLVLKNLETPKEE